MDAIDLKIFWNQIVGIANEQGRALKRIAFSPIVREAGDLCVAICDPQGRMVANAETGTPGHMNTISNALQAFFEDHPVETMQPGDVLITNDPWAGSGHLFDIVVMVPTFSAAGRLIAFVGSCIHHTDIGGYGVGSGARDVHEEGLWIPPLKLHEAGRPNETLLALIRRNVRAPGHVLGDIAAQISCGRIGSERLLALCARHGIADIDEPSEQIIRLSEEATRNAIRQLRSGVHHAETSIDVLGPQGRNQVVTLKVALHIDAERGEILADFAGSSDASPLGINVVPGYAHAYVRFAVRSALNPEWPNNHGSLEPIGFVAPPRSVVNAAYPAPVSGRHTVGMFIPMAINKALYQVVPQAVIAESIGGKWGLQISGLESDGKPFVSCNMAYSGGMGARAAKPGLSTTAYPVGIGSMPIEILERTLPIVFDRKAICPDTGGAGMQRGGDGQVIEFHLRTGQPWTLNASINRTATGPDGIGGGGRGAAGRFAINGKPMTVAGKLGMEPGDVVLLQTPGGGGFGLPQG